MVRFTALGAVWMLAVFPLMASEPVGIRTAESVLPGLEPILYDALQRSPRMISENLDLLRAEQLRYVSSSGLYPDASGYVQFLQQRESRLQSTGSTEDKSIARTYYSASVTQPLFHWGALRARAEVGKIQAEIAQNNVVEAYRKLALEIRRSYLDLIIGKASLRSFERRIEDSRKEIETREIAVELGAGSKGALSSVRTKLRQTELARDRAVRDFEDSVSLFARLTGVEDFEVENVPDEIPIINMESGLVLEPLRANYVEQNSFEDDARYVADRLRVDTERLNESIIKTNLRPKLNFVAGVTQDERSDTVNVAERYEYSALYAGVSVSWRIFDGFESRGRRLAAGTRIRQSEQRMNETAEALVRQVERSVSNLEFARRSLEFVESSLRGTRTRIDRAREDYEMGQVSADTIADAESRELDAQLAAFRERATYLNAAAELLSSVGADPVVEAAIPEILKR